MDVVLEERVRHLSFFINLNTSYNELKDSTPNDFFHNLQTA